MEHKLNVNQSLDPVSRNLDRIRHHLTEMGYQYHSPLLEPYSSERTDCEASIAGELSDHDMRITKVIKPMIYQKTDVGESLIQKAIVIVES